MSTLSRPKRIHEPGLRHFVTFSTYKRRTYLAPLRTRDIVLEVLQKVLVDHEASCAGFVVMPDHVHAILFGGEKFNISQIVQVWKKTSSYRIRQFYEKEFAHYQGACPDSPAIWQPGFHDFYFDSDAANIQKLDYMHNNPTEARLVDNALDWSWSSARFYERGESVGVEITY
jgi:putative transposase